MVHARTRIAVATIMLLGATGTFAQQTLKEKPDDPLLAGQGKSITPLAQPTGMALESTINPQTYVVGPSDGIAVNIWLSPPLSFMLTVTPEGTLIVPTIGETKVAGLTLARAKERVLQEIRTHYLRVEATVTLVGPRPIVINVVGQVLNPGLYTLTAADRAGRAFELANQILVSQRGNAQPPPLDIVALRCIRVRHRDGTEDRVDLPLYVATKNEALNPLLREGDVVIVPSREPSRNVVGIYGEVNTPGRFEFIPGDSLNTLLRLANGFAAHARVDSVLFSRLDSDGTTQTIEVIDFAAVANGSSPDQPLQSGDRIIVPTLIDLRQDYRVFIGGEVKNPGVYPITRDRTHLSDAIRLAGGFTDFASVKDGQLIRRSINPSEVELETLESLRGGIATEDSTDYQLETRLRIRKEIVSVDFERLFLLRDTTQDVYLRTEDNISIPTRKKTVYVFGQIVTNGHIPFVLGESLEFYISKAGGYTERARAGDVKIVKARTRQWLSPAETVIEPGDYIWVPRRVEHSFEYYMNIVGQTASIISVGVSIVLLVIQLQK